MATLDGITGQGRAVETRGRSRAPRRSGFIRVKPADLKQLVAAMERGSATFSGPLEVDGKATFRTFAVAITKIDPATCIVDFIQAGPIPGIDSNLSK